ncbi:MAG: hypothetical protein ACRBEQ_13480 [Hyphomonas sp.]
MTPYSRFDRISSGLSVTALLLLVGLGAPRLVAFSAGLAPREGAMAVIGALAVLALIWICLRGLVFPILFRLSPVRRMVLGKQYIEGTWLAAERGGAKGPRLAVMNIRPARYGFAVTGHTLTPDFEVESNSRVEHYALEWPIISFKMRNALSDGTDGQSEGIGEIQFDENVAMPLRFTGFSELLRAGRRVRIEGTKLTRWRDVRGLRKLDTRREVLGRFWQQFYNTPAPAPLGKNPFAEDLTKRDKKAASAKGVNEDVVPRRRASDWRDTDETPATDRIRAKSKIGSKFSKAEPVSLSGDKQEDTSKTDGKKKASAD